MRQRKRETLSRNEKKEEEVRERCIKRMTRSKKNIEEERKNRKKNGRKRADGRR